MIFGSTALLKLHNISIHSSQQQWKTTKNWSILRKKIIWALDNILFVNCFGLLAYILGYIQFVILFTRRIETPVLYIATKYVWKASKYGP